MWNLKAILVLTIGLVGLQTACAHPIAGLKRGEDLSPWTPEALAAEIPQGAAVVIGENHGVRLHRDQHLVILEALRRAGHRVSVGLEFFPASGQPDVDAWRRGELTEPDFLVRIGWGSTPFDFYREQALFPRLEEGARTLALNAPRELTRRVAKVGLEGLSPSERALLPPDFRLGRDVYRERFLRQMPHLPDPAAGDRYFAAQSVWDDTMAWVASEFLKQRPADTLVIVVGEFHVQYGGGLPDRLRARTSAPVFSLSQVDLHGLSPEEAVEAIRPRGREGVRADAVWAEDARLGEGRDREPDLSGEGGAS